MNNVFFNIDYNFEAGSDQLSGSNLPDRYEMSSTLQMRRKPN